LALSVLAGLVVTVVAMAAATLAVLEVLQQWLPVAL
jgi:hypothetical protein